MKFLAETSLPSLGDISGAYSNSDREIIAVPCRYRLLTEPRARASYGGYKLRHRIALYKKNQRLPFAFFDRLKYDVNDIAFHPELPVVAIATGSYDGGWIFEGELVLWNWETDESNLMVESIPEVVRVTFNANGDKVLAFVRPWDEGMIEDLNLSDDAFDVFYELVATFFESLEQGLSGSESVSKQMLAQKPVSRKTIDQDLRFQVKITDFDAAVSEHCGIETIKARSPIWDVAWLKDSKIAIVHDDCNLEVLDISGKIQQSFSGKGHGCEIIAGTPPLIHVSEIQEDADDWHEQYKSTLYRLKSDTLVEEKTFVGAYTISRDVGGRVLARRDRSGAPQKTKMFDYLFRNGEWVALDLGRYDVFNHFVKVDGAPTLFFVQDDVPNRDPFEDMMARSKKWLCSLQVDGNIKRIWRVLPDDETHASTALECFYTYIDNGTKKAIIASGRHYSPNPYEPFSGFIYRKNLDSDKEVWSHPTAASPTVIRYVNDQNLVIGFFLNGDQMVINADTGKILRQKKFTPNSIPSVICSCDILGENAVVGTMDGRVATIKISEIATI